MLAKWVSARVCLLYRALLKDRVTLFNKHVLLPMTPLRSTRKTTHDKLFGPQNLEKYYSVYSTVLVLSASL